MCTCLSFRRGELDADSGVVVAVHTGQGLQRVNDVFGRGRVGDGIRGEATEGKRERPSRRRAGKLLLLVVLLAVGILHVFQQKKRHR